MTFCTYVGSWRCDRIVGQREERHLGTAQWQLLLPMASWKQWVVKAATALGLAMLPGSAVLALLMGFVQRGHVQIGAEFPACAMTLLLTTVSLYVSSLSTSGVKALFLSVPVPLRGVPGRGALVGQRRPFPAFSRDALP